MWEFFRLLFGTDFMPHVYCLRGSAPVLWLHVVSDLAIALAYLAIPLVLVELLRKRRDNLFRPIGFLFVAFIVACAGTHLLSVWTLWIPMYRLEGVAKASTAAVSIATAVALIRLRPVLLRLPSIAQLETEIDERKRAEAAFHEQRERFSSFVESVQDYAVYMLDARGFVQTWNSGAEHITGYKSDEIIGQHVSRFYGAEELARDGPEQALRVARTNSKYETECWRIRKDGSRFWANIILRALRDNSGTLIGFSKVTRDLTESRAMEAKFRTLLESTPDAVLIVDRLGLLQFANRRAEGLFGYTGNELAGMPFEALVPKRFRGRHGSYREVFFDSPRDREMGADQELWGLRKDGSEFSLEFSLSPLETAEGRVVLAAVRDVTERKKIEIRFRALLDFAPDAMVIVGSSGLIEIANRQTEKLFGYSRTELIGQSVDTLVPEHLRAAHGEHRGNFLAAPLQREMGAGLDLMALRRDGSLFPVEISLSPVEGPDGTSVTAAIRDITERKRAAGLLNGMLEELRRSNEALEQFAHIASHDLQEPLRMVASYTQLLARRYKGRLDQDADEFIAYAVDGTQRMKRLINDLLRYSRAGSGVPQLGEVRCEEILQQALGNLQAAIDDCQAIITHDPLPILTEAHSQLVQIFQNLIGNAIKYRRGCPPAIHICARRQPGEWIFSVSDNGIGIDPQYFERIFVIFQRLHGQDEYEGTGIGLAICKRILQAQGGRIWVESNPGSGSTFHFTLPVR
jgi:PAS domain S-box-containing protein